MDSATLDTPTEAADSDDTLGDLNDYEYAKQLYGRLDLEPSSVRSAGVGGAETSFDASESVVETPLPNAPLLGANEGVAALGASATPVPLAASSSSEMLAAAAAAGGAARGTEALAARSPLDAAASGTGALAAAALRDTAGVEEGASSRAAQPAATSASKYNSEEPVAASKVPAAAQRHFAPLPVISNAAMARLPLPTSIGTRSSRGLSMAGQQGPGCGGGNDALLGGGGVQSAGWGDGVVGGGGLQLAAALPSLAEQPVGGL